MKLKIILKELGLTVLIGGVLGGVFIFLTDFMHLPLLESHQKPVFFTGVVLFSLVFRMFPEKRERRK